MFPLVHLLNKICFLERHTLRLKNINNITLLYIFVKWCAISFLDLIILFRNPISHPISQIENDPKASLVLNCQSSLKVKITGWVIKPHLLAFLGRPRLAQPLTFQLFKSGVPKPCLQGPLPWAVPWVVLGQLQNKQGSGPWVPGLVIPDLK